FFFFFFQAEDGIRDYKVTGVQTCALPISGCRGAGLPPRRSRSGASASGCIALFFRSFLPGRPGRCPLSALLPSDHSSQHAVAYYAHGVLLDSGTLSEGSAARDLSGRG